MKRILLIFLIIAGSITAQAQDGKPTKEQTVEYILNKLNSKTNFEWVADSENGTYRKSETTVFIFNKGFSINNCILKFSTTIKTKVENYTQNTVEEKLRSEDYEVDLSKCESIGWRIAPLYNRSPGNYFLTFYSTNESNVFKKNGEKLSKVSLSIDEVISLDSKTYKAFNHLRKLCGAPEPIEF